jgi:Phosphotransferase enzyme family
VRWVRWLGEGSAEALAGALREVAPELSGYPIVIPGDIGPGSDPQWWASSALIGTEFVAKFAWSRPAALRVRRERFAAWVDPERHRSVRRWCDWADAVLAETGPAVLVHADFHGDNQVWDHGELRLVVDFETVGLAEPEYDLSGVPGPGLGPGVELLTAVVRHYQEAAGCPLSVERIMAWHVRQALGDVLWRTDLGIHLADHRTPPDWVNDLAARFRALGFDL